jgi:hypothetical protein
MIDMPIDFSSTTTQNGVFLRERDQPVIFGRPSSASTVANIDTLRAAMRANFAAATYQKEVPVNEDLDFRTEPINRYRLMVPIRYRGMAAAPDFHDDDDVVLFDE